MDIWLNCSTLCSPLILAQNETLPNIWENVGADPATIATILSVLFGIIFLILLGTYRYQKWKKYKTFEEEMKALDLHPDEEGTFAWMVKRYSMDEPVNIIFSARLFDEMATNEIQNVLSSNAPLSAKSRFINTVYDIRMKTYHPDWVAPKKEISGDDLESPIVNLADIELEKE